MYGVLRNINKRNILTVPCSLVLMLKLLSLTPEPVTTHYSGVS
jgi:hypothetical protein